MMAMALAGEELEFDSPEVAKEFPGLYAKEDKEMSEKGVPDYDEEDKKHKKKEKKKKEDERKGYAALADENSQDEEEQEHHGKKKLKGFLSGKKKDKEPKEKDKDKVKEPKEKDKQKKVQSEEKKGPFERDTPLRIPFSVERHRDVHLNKASGAPANLVVSASTPPKGGESVPVPEKEKGSALNAFLNAPAPLFLQKKKEKKEKDQERKKDKEKDKEHKKDKEKEKKEKEKKEKEHSKDKKDQPSGVAKVKLKLLRSKNSLEDPFDKGDLHVSVSHQFPEDPEAIKKEIKKYEQLLEQTHAQIKTSKKVSKKQEEHLWELQRTVTGLKRKLRSLNALSTLSPHHVSDGSGPEAHQSVSSVPRPPSGSREPDSIIPAPPEYSSPPLTTKSPVPTPSHARDSGPAIATEEIQAAKEGVNATDCDSNVSAKGRSSLLDTVVPIIKPPRKSVRRSLDFSEAAMEKTSLPCGSDVPTLGPSEVPDVEHTIHQEHEKVQVQVIVHSESKDEDEYVHYDDDGDSSIARSDDEAFSASSKNEENIDTVVNDANAMIGSMHEELEAAALVFGHNFKSFKNPTGSKSEPTFGEQFNDSSDVELIRDDEEEDGLDIEDMIPVIMNFPEFQTPEYLRYENDQLVIFNSMIEEEIVNEENEIESLAQQLESGRMMNNEPSDEYGMEELITMWKTLKAENGALHANVARLRQLVSINKLEEFKLETRLRYLEERHLPISPITAVTPLHSET